MFALSPHHRALICDEGFDSLSRRLCDSSFISGDGLGDVKHVSFGDLVGEILFNNGEAFGINFQISDPVGLAHSFVFIILGVQWP